MVSLWDVLLAVCISDAVVAGFAQDGGDLHKARKTRHEGRTVAGSVQMRMVVVIKGIVVVATEEIESDDKHNEEREEKNKERRG